MAKQADRKRTPDPNWPTSEDDHDHPVTELAADRQGSLSPYGEVAFPVTETPYVHPETEINWKKD